MKEQIKQLKADEISSDVFVIAPTQLEYIADIFSKNFADTMNMRTFAGRIRDIAIESLYIAMRAAKKMGEKH